MKKIFTWFILFQKRILKKPMFQVTLFLIPALLLLLFAFKQSNNSLVKVALSYGKEDVSKEFAKELFESTNDVIQFYECDNEEEVYTDVLKGKAECGYVINDSISEYVKSGGTKSNGKPIKVVNKNSSVTTMVLNEMIVGKIFPKITYKVLQEFMQENQADLINIEGEEEKMAEYFEYYRKPEMMFKFEYANGKENMLLNQTNNNYYMMPVRGILAVLILVAAMSGILMLSNDDKKGAWQWIKLNNRYLFNYAYVYMTIFLVALCSLAAICFTGISTSIFTEIFIMLIYTLLVTGFCNFLRALVRNIYFLCSLIPVLVLISLVICPVFVDLGSIVPGMDIVRLFIPVNYYLEATYSAAMQIKMFAAAVIFSVVGMGIDIFRTRKI